MNKNSNEHNCTADMATLMSVGCRGECTGIPTTKITTVPSKITYIPSSASFGWNWTDSQFKNVLNTFAGYTNANINAVGYAGRTHYIQPLSKKNQNVDIFTKIIRITSNMTGRINRLEYDFYLQSIKSIEGNAHDFLYNGKLAAPYPATIIYNKDLDEYYVVSMHNPGDYFRISNYGEFLDPPSLANPNGTLTITGTI